jgi:hypothetical protein
VHVAGVGDPGQEPQDPRHDAFWEGAAAVDRWNELVATLDDAS